MKAKNYFLVLLVVLIAISTPLFSAGQKESKSEKVIEFTAKAPTEYVGKITEWRHSNQPSWFIENFNKVYPNAEVDLTIVSPSVVEYTQKTLNAVVSGVDAPDIFQAWSQTIGQIKDSNLWENLSAPPYNAEEIADKLVPYTVDVGRDAQGNIRALSFQATIGGVFYRRSLAKKYLGTDDPEKVGQMFSTEAGMLEVAEKIKKGSNGTISFMGDPSSLTFMYLCSREEPWVKDGKLIIDPMVDHLFDLAKTIRDNGYDAKIKDFTAPWFGTMQNSTVFSYALPTWGLNYILMPNAPDTAGDWAVTNGPKPYIEGGVWIGINKDSKNKELAWEYLKYVLLDVDSLFKIGTERGVFVSCIEAQDKIAEEVTTGPAIDFLGGQQCYNYFREHILEVKPELITMYDQSIMDFMNNEIEAYITGKKTKSKAMQSLIDSTLNAYPELSYIK
jgi:ABC-type glycerol-3-phosphate transport system substrate-binding protein